MPVSAFLGRFVLKMFALRGSLARRGRSAQHVDVAVFAAGSGLCPFPRRPRKT
jgi:hypothetical protein